MLLTQLNIADDRPETRLAGLGMHVLAITPTMIHNFTKVRDSKPDGARKTSADSTVI